MPWSQPAQKRHWRGGHPPTWPWPSYLKMKSLGRPALRLWVRLRWIIHHRPPPAFLHRWGEGGGWLHLLITYVTLTFSHLGLPSSLQKKVFRESQKPEIAEHVLPAAQVGGAALLPARTRGQPPAEWLRVTEPSLLTYGSLTSEVVGAGLGCAKVSKHERGLDEITPLSLSRSGADTLKFPSPALRPASPSWGRIS